MPLSQSKWIRGAWEGAWGNGKRVGEDTFCSVAGNRVTFTEQDIDIWWEMHVCNASSWPISLQTTKYLRQQNLGGSQGSDSQYGCKELQEWVFSFLEWLQILRFRGINYHAATEEWEDVFQVCSWNLTACWQVHTNICWDSCCASPVLMGSSQGCQQRGG